MTYAQASPFTVEVQHTEDLDLPQASSNSLREQAADRMVSMYRDKLDEERLLELFNDEIEASDERLREIVRASAGEYRTSVTKFRVAGLGYDEFLAWYIDMIHTGGGRLLRGHPEHIVQHRGEDHWVVVEPIGGSPLRMIVTRAAEGEISIEPDPEYPQWMGTVNSIRLLDGTQVGYITHRIGDLGGEGFRVKTQLMFPKASPDELIIGHCEHLAVEFHYWLANAYAELHGGA